jgi:hypothetical protein
MTPLRIAGVLLFYSALFVIIHMYRDRIDRSETKTFLVIGGAWAVVVFLGNYLLYRAGLMSFLPWTNNFLHTFIWIGFCLTWLYLGVREGHALLVQCIAFATFSLVVKYAEQMAFGTWDYGHFFHVFRGNFAYVLGWSLADGLYPPLTLVGLRILGRWVPGLIVQ